jgi:hypothetical protein
MISMIMDLIICWYVFGLVSLNLAMTVGLSAKKLNPKYKSIDGKLSYQFVRDMMIVSACGPVNLIFVIMAYGLRRDALKWQRNAKHGIIL